MQAPTFSIAFQTDKPLAAYGPLAVQAEGYGFDGVSVYNDMLYQPAWLPLLEIARATRRVRIGPAAVNPFTCHPITIAGHIALLDEASHGRAYLGLARGSWLDFVGLAPRRPITALREAFLAVRHLLRRSPEPLPGDIFPLAGGDSLRWPIRRAEIPFLLGTWGERTLRACLPFIHEVKLGGTANPGVVPWMREVIRRYADDQRRTTDDEGRTTDDQRRTTKDEGRTTDDQRRTTDDQRRTTNDEGRTTDDQRRTTNDDPITQSPCHPITLSPNHLVTLSPCHPPTRSNPSRSAFRSSNEIGVVVGSVTVVDEDGAAARARARREVALYLPVVAQLDPTVPIEPERLARIQEAAARYDFAAAARDISDELLARFALAGTPEQVAQQVVALVQAGASRVEFGTPHGLTPEHGLRLLGERVLPLVQGTEPPSLTS